MTETQSQDTTTAEHDEESPNEPPRLDSSEAGEQVTPSDGEPIYRTTPTLRPTLIFLGVTLLLGLSSIGYLFLNPTLVGGDEQLTELVQTAIGVLLLLIVVRLLIRLFILRKTKYIIRTDVLRREFTFLFRHWSREVPIRQLRGHEFSQNRIQTLLGFGTIRMLTGGTNQSLGFVEFEDVPRPGVVREHIQELTIQSRTNP